MKILVIVLISALLFTVLGQSTSRVYNVRGRISITPVLQNWVMKDNGGEKNRFSEQSNLFSLHYPILENWQVGLTGAQARVNGDVPGLNGLTDVQAYTNYRLRSLNIVLGLQVNLPSGKTELNRSEFESSFAISNPIFRFRVPSFGQGLNVSPSIMWVIPIKDVMVLGLGASYQYLGSYTSIQSTAKYKPGDEILVTAGMDFRLNRTTRLSGDVILTKFGRDSYQNQEIYAAGDKILLSAQIKKYFGYHLLQLVGLYRSRAKNDLLAQNRKLKTIPNNFEVRLNYMRRISGKIYLNLMGESWIYEKSEVMISDGYVLGGGIKPEFRLNNNINLQLIGKYYSGYFHNNISLSGYEISMGVDFIL